MSLIWAEFISFWANWVLVGALIVGVIATWGIVVSSNVKEDASKREIARLSADAEASRAAIAEATARAAEADEKAESERLARVKIEQRLASRAFSNEQASEIIESLNPYHDTRIDLFVNGNELETNVFGWIISKLLELAHWKTDSWVWTGVTPSVGLIIAVNRDADSEILKAADALVTALNKTGNPVFRMEWSGDWAHFGGMLNGKPFNNNIAAPIRLIIGSKPLPEMQP